MRVFFCRAGVKKIQNRSNRMGTAASDEDLERVARLNSEVNTMETIFYIILYPEKKDNKNYCKKLIQIIPKHYAVQKFFRFRSNKINFEFFKHDVTSFCKFN